MNVESRPLAKNIGAEIRNVDLSRPMDDETRDGIFDVWRDAGVLLFRRQLLSEQDMLNLAGRLGVIETMFRRDINSHFYPAIHYVSNLRYDDSTHVGGLGNGELDWHTDQTYMKHPSTGAILYGVEVPPHGGHTLFANQYLAYENLPDDVKARIEGRNGIFSYATRLGKYEYEAKKMADSVVEKKPDMAHPEEEMEVAHPLVLVHPVSGRRALYADSSTMARIEGLEEDESEALKAVLHEYATGNPDIVYEHIWKNGDVLFWDNACVMHRRTPLDPNTLRLLKRVNVVLPADRFCLPH